MSEIDSLKRRAEAAGAVALVCLESLTAKAVRRADAEGAGAEPDAEGIFYLDYAEEFAAVAKVNLN